MTSPVPAPATVPGAPRRVGLTRRPDLAAWLRHRAWRTAFRAIGGFRVTGRAPVETMVVAANHSSHLDTPALVAALPAVYRPVVVAAGDYWYRDRLRSSFLRAAVGAIPVDRDGGGYEQLADAAQEVLGTGSSLLIYPEGTRGTGGHLGRFRSGAVRLSQEYEVPMLPVAIVGTGDLLPKRGALHPGPVEVRVGEAIRPEDLDEGSADLLRERIEELLARGPAVPETSRTWLVLRRYSDSPYGLLGAAAWGFAEALVLPVTAEMYLLVFAVASPRRVVPASAVLAAGSVAGVLVNAALARRGVRVPAPITNAPMQAAVDAHMAAGPKGLWRQALNGVPVKLYARSAGSLGQPLGRVALAAAGARGTRALVFGGLVAVASGRSQPFLRRFFGPYLGVLAVGFSAGLAAVVRSWRRKGES